MRVLQSRQVAHKAVSCEGVFEIHAAVHRGHDALCDIVTEAIDARDAEQMKHLETYALALLDVTAERDRIRAALEEIAEYGTDWTVGAAQNIANLQAIADRALNPEPTT